MSANNPNVSISQLRGGRANPQAPVQSNTNALAVNKSVPIVAPPTTISSSYGGVGGGGGILGLAQALGVFNQGVQQLGQRYAAQQALQREIQQQRDVGAGYIEANKQAIQARDAAQQATDMGQLPAHMNPAQKFGYQIGTAGLMLSQYRNELVQARAKNPLVEPGQLQGEILGRFLEAGKSIDPIVFNKFFVSPLQAANQDDQKLFLKNQELKFKQDTQASVGAEIFNALESESHINPENFGSLREDERPRAGDTVVQAANTRLATSYATGLPVQESAITIVETVMNHALTQGTLAEAEAEAAHVLKIVSPSSGQPIISNPEVAAVYFKMRKQLSDYYLDKENKELEIASRKREEITGQQIDKMTEDANKFQLKPVGDYRVAGSNPEKLTSIYRALESTGAPQQMEVEETATVAKERVRISNTNNKQILDELINDYGSDPSLSSSDKSVLINNALQQKKDVERAENTKTPSYSVSQLVDGSVNRIINFSTNNPYKYNRSWINQTVAFKDSPKVINNKTRFAARRWKIQKLDQFVTDNPQADPVAIRNYSDSLDSTIQSAWDNLNGAYERKEGSSVDQLLNKGIDYWAKNSHYQSTPKVLSPTEKLLKVTPKQPAEFKRLAPWATNRESFTKAKSDFYKGYGPIWDWFYTLGKTKGKSGYDLVVYTKNHNPDVLIEQWAASGFPTFLGNQKEPSSSSTSGGKN